MAYPLEQDTGVMVSLMSIKKCRRDGFSKVYEVVLNNDPSYAFLLDTNTNIANTMVAAHVIGHVHFFKNNFLFKKLTTRWFITPQKELRE